MTYGHFFYFLLESFLGCFVLAIAAVACGRYIGKKLCPFPRKWQDNILLIIKTWGVVFITRIAWVMFTHQISPNTDLYLFNMVVPTLIGAVFCKNALKKANEQKI